MNLLLVWTAVCGILGMGPGEGDARQADGMTFRIPENSPPGARVGVVPHADGATRFELVDDAAPFAVETATGAITVRDGSTLNFEERAEYRLTVRVTTAPPAPPAPPAPDEDPLWQSFAERLGGEDSELLAPREQPEPQSETVTERQVVVQLVDVNEAPSMAAQRFDASAMDAAPAVVGSIVANDPDAGERLTFAVVAGDEDGAFEVDPESGRLTIHADRLALDNDAEQAALRVRVTDRDGLTSEADITVKLPQRATLPPPSPVADAPPVEAPRPPVFVQGTEAGPSPGETPVGDPPTETPVTVTPPQDSRPNQTAPHGTQSAGPTVAVAPQPTPPTTEPVQATAPVWQRWLAGGVSPLLIVLTGLLAALAHVLRVRALRRQWSRSTHRDAGQAVESTDRQELEAGFGELIGQREKLAADVAQLAEDEALLADERQQLEREREELATQQVQLAAAESELADARAALEQERRQLEAERDAFEERIRHEAGRGYGAGEDLYAVDEEPDASTLGGRDPGASTWVDSAETTDGLEQDAELSALRSNLAEMFGVPMDAAAKEDAPPSTGSGTALSAPRSAAPGSRESLYRQSAPGGPNEGEGDSISSYMEALMKRLRQNTAAPASSGAAVSTAPRPKSPTEERAPATPQAAAVAPRPAMTPAAAPMATKPAVPPQPAPAPRPVVDKTAVRETVNSLREVANWSARSAMATYVRRKRKRRGVLVGLTYVALLALAAALLGGVLGAPVVGGAQRWIVLGMGAVVILHYASSICLVGCPQGHSDRQSRKKRRRAAPPVSEDAPAQPPEPAAEQPARSPARRTASEADGASRRELVGSAAADSVGSGAN